MKIAVVSFLLLSVLVILQSCATLTKEECLNGDWQAIGERDGAQGLHPGKQLKLHAAACKLAKVEPDQEVWIQGYKIGLVTYCTPLSGLFYGQLGKPYYKVCPDETEPDFLRGHYLGRKESSYKSLIRSSEFRIDSLNRDIDNLLDDIAEAKPEDISGLRSDIRSKRYSIKSETNNMQEYYRDLSNVEFLVERFKQDPKLEYDPASL